MFENFRSFADYIRDYELQRAEGLLLRHLNSVYKVLKQTVPDAAKTDAVREMELYLGTMIRAVDSSLMDEWEQMRDPAYERRIAAERAKDAGVDLRPPGAEEAAADITRDAKAFTAAIRNRIFTFLRGLVIGEFGEALESLAGSTRGSGGASGSPPDASGMQDVAGEPSETTSQRPVLPEEAWTAERLQNAMDAYLTNHQALLLTPEARNLRHTYVTPSEDKRTWRVQQMLVDPEGHNDWVAEFEVDLAASRAAVEPVLRLRQLGRLA
jgi:hypothetical protein